MSLTPAASSRTAWPEARRLAAASTRPLPVVERPLTGCLGLALAADLTARTDLPAFPTAAMDGWAVAGPGPWRLVGEVLAGAVGAPLSPGTAVRIATGAALPAGAHAVLRREHGRAEAGRLHVDAAPTAPQPGTDVRPRAGECRAGDVVAAAGTRVTPAVVGLAAAAGHDTLRVRHRPRVAVLVLGDELLAAGPATDARVRDALGPMLPGWLTALGAAVAAPLRVEDSRAALDFALDAVLGGALDPAPGDGPDGAKAGVRADLVLTTGSTARGPVDHLHACLAGRSGTLVVDGVAVRPGHPMLLALLDDGRPLVGLPGNPLAAVSALLTLAEPVLGALLGAAPRAAVRRALRDGVTGHPRDTRLVPVAGGTPLRHAGPAMLRGLAVADAMAVVPPGGTAPGSPVEVLPLPW